MGQRGCPRTQWRRLQPPLQGKAPPVQVCVRHRVLDNLPWRATGRGGTGRTTANKRSKPTTCLLCAGCAW
eukprot:7239927-Alexandrium_andersonii.AAC.1